MEHVRQWIKHIYYNVCLIRDINEKLFTLLKSPLNKDFCFKYWHYCTLLPRQCRNLELYYGTVAHLNIDWANIWQMNTFYWNASVFYPLSKKATDLQNKYIFFPLLCIIQADTAWYLHNNRAAFSLSARRLPWSYGTVLTPTAQGTHSIVKPKVRKIRHSFMRKGALVTFLHCLKTGTVHVTKFMCLFCCGR